MMRARMEVERPPTSIRKALGRYEKGTIVRGKQYETGTPPLEDWWSSCTRLVGSHCYVGILGTFGTVFKLDQEARHTEHPEDTDGVRTSHCLLPFFLCKLLLICRALSALIPDTSSGP